MAIKRDAADKWFSDVVRARVNWKCESCDKAYGGRHAGIHCAHIYGRANKAVRWDLDNAVSLCYTCHRHFTENPIEFHNWLQVYLGQGHMDLLVEKKNQTFKTTEAIRKEIAKHYKGEFQSIENNPSYIPINFT